MQCDLPGDWQAVLGSHLESDWFTSLWSFLRAEREAGPVFPPEPDVFNAFALAPYDKVKLVLIGQDPYHDDGQAHGLCFSVKRGVPAPPSLRNMFKELKTDLGIDAPDHGNLEGWARQGVLLLNAVLTVRAHEANSHKDRGWERFTDQVIDALDKRTEPVVFALWGAYAQKKGKRITNPRHVVVKAAHPSPLSAKLFLGSRPFSAIDAALRDAGHTPIDWRLWRMRALWLLVAVAACGAAPKPFDGTAMYRSGRMHELRDRIRSERSADADADARNRILLARVYIDLRVVWDDATFDDALAALAPAHPADPRLVAELEQATGEAMFWRRLVDEKGAWEDVQKRFERARELRIAAHDARGVAESTFYLGLVAQFVETTTEARVWFERALDLSRTIDDPLLRSYPVRHLADLAEQAGELDKAAALHREALELRERAGDVVRLFNARVTLATFLCERMCDCEAASPQIEEARRVADALRMPHGKDEVAALEGRLAKWRGARAAGRLSTVCERANAGDPD